MCNDGVVGDGEQCEDGNTADGDGCNVFCLVEPGWHCSGLPAVCMTQCGDGARGGTEECDDGNLLPDDGCDPQCVFQRLQEVEPNDNFEQADLNGALQIGWLYEGGIPTPSDDDFFLLVVTTPVDLRIQVAGPAGLGTCTATDLLLDVYDEAGNRVTFDRDSGAEFCPEITPELSAWAKQTVPGRYYLRLRPQTSSASMPQYLLHLSVSAVCGDGVLQGYEQCEGTGALCDQCQHVPICNNGQLERGEQCDDGNMVDSDGCDSLCRIVSSHRCTGTMPSVCTLVEYDCNNVVDDDADGSTDAADPDCSWVSGVTGCAAGQRQLVWTGRDTPRALADRALTVAGMVAPAEVGLVRRAVLRMSLSHPVPSQLEVTLVSPSLRPVVLTSGNGVMTDTGFVQTIFDDGCATSITAASAPYTGCFQPQGMLTSLVGDVGTGQWTMNIQDDTTHMVGTLVSWNLMLCVDP